MKSTSTCLIIAAAVLLASCEKHETTASAPPAASTQALSPELEKVLQNAPAGEPQSIHLIRATAAPGDEITISGKIMGNAKPFVDGRAAFILGDPEILTPCNENPGDECETPWDVCCDSKEDKKRGTATVQILDSTGRVFSQSIEGHHGLQNLASLTVTGTVAEGSSPELLIINASAIQAMPD